MRISPNGLVFLFMTCLFLPWLAIKSALKLKASGKTPTRAQHLASVAVSQGMMLLLALVAAHYDDIRLFPPLTIAPLHVVGALAFLGVSLGTLPMRWRWKPDELKRRSLWMLPSKPADLAWWAGVALMAGIVEEIAFRGVMFTLWYRMLGSWWASVSICAIVFGLAHFVQGVRTVVVIVILSVGMHVLVRWTGSLYVAMAVHFVYDLFAGMLLFWLARRDGLLPGPHAAVAPTGEGALG